MKAYAGIGSRECPPDILKDMEQFAQVAASHLTLRSGGAPGADTAFEAGAKNAKGHCEIFLPWKNFNKNSSPLFEVHNKAIEIAATIHPGFKYMKRPVKLLIARNMHQILGKQLDEPVEFVICWTKDGCENYQTYSKNTGGTGSAIALASKCGIPVYNLFNENSLILSHKHLIDFKS